MIPFSELKRPEKVYSFVDPSTNQMVTFAVDRMLKSIQVKLIPECFVKLSMEYAASLLEDGLNGDKLKRFMGMRFTDPVLMVRYPDGKDILVDGQYRYCASAARGQTEIMARRVPQSVWTKFLVTGVPFTAEQLNKLAQRPN